MLSNEERFQCLHEIIDAARETLNADIWDYLQGGTDSETTLKRNRLALDSLALRPRVLVDVGEVSCATNFLGRQVRLPVMLAPVGSLESFTPEGGVTACAGASMFGAGMCLSSVSKVSLEQVAAAGSGLKMFQLYKRGDDTWTDDIIKRVIAAGYDAFCFTVDSAYYSRRERDIAKRFVKSWVASSTGRNWQAQLNWDDVKRYKDTYDMPLALKGIQHPADAALAVEHGAEIIWVSNHGGRQIDQGEGSMALLPEVVAAVDGKAKIIVDGCIQRGTDIAKAIALGADMVGIGRLMCCALAAGGSSGVVRLLELLETELSITLGLMGVTSLDQLSPHYVKAAPSASAPSVFSAFPHLDELVYNTRVQ
jgi:glycolate oxidase